MAEIQLTNIRDIKFTRDTKVDYKSGNPIINTIFQRFDTDNSGDFDDAEWSRYEKYLEKRERKPGAVESHYRKQFDKIVKKSEELAKKYQKAMTPNYFEELINFEQAHPEVLREGYQDEKELPPNAYKYDISNFGMGIYDEETGYFTGETYEHGYINGLETLSEEEKKQYLTLLDKASKMIDNCTKIEKQLNELEQESDRLQALCDMANTGMIDKVGSKDYEEKAYQAYVEIRSEKNPFYKEIQEIEAKRNALNLKGNKTEEDKKLLESYNRHLTQLYIASSQWSVSDTDNVEKFEVKTGANYQMTHSMPNEESVKNGGEISFSVGAAGSYQDENLDIQGSVNITREFKKTKLLDNQYTMSFSGKYDHGGKIYKTDLNCDITSDNRNYDLSLAYENGDFSASLQDIESYTRGEEGFDHVRTTNLNAAYNVDKYNFSAGLTKSGDMTTYSLNAGMDGISTPIGSFTPSLTNQYSSLTKRFTTSPSLGFSKEYKVGDLSAGIQVNDNYNLTFGHGKPEHENNISVVTNVEYKGFQGQLQYNNMYSGYSKSNTYGVSLKYSTQKAGTFGAEYSYNRMNSCGSIERTQTVSLTYSAPIDWFTKKRH